MATEAMPVIRIDLAARLWVVVERTGDMVAFRHRQGDEVIKRRHQSVRLAMEILVCRLGDARIGRRRRDERVDRVLNEFPLALRLGGSLVAGASR